ncbi:hypothetical protein F5I97DRAFT_1841973 [Phlebopus sp. FC_14]|nr:hypothetical protein F5I97DRAFT_1841973 [Phlebopus sp. FC_14]
MDASGSPSIVIDDDTNASLVGPNTTMREVTGSANPPDVFVPGEEDDDHVLPPPSCTALPRRRSSARIRQQRVQHQRASSAELTRAKTVLSSADKPREFVIRLPFTSNTTHPVVAARDSSPRVLRSHSRRSTGATPFLNMEETDGKKKKKGVLMRSRSERLPQVETPFVTIQRPRYRFGRRKSKRAKSEDEVRV